MRIEVGKYAGFCAGVKRAVDGTFACAREFDGEITTDGELIHNPQTLGLLRQHDVITGDENAPVEALAGKVVVVRAHGTTPERLRELRDKAARVHNFTCRDVARVQAKIRKASAQGRSVVVFGKPTHPEVRGLLGFATDGYVVTRLQDVDDLPPRRGYLVVSQTTMNPEDYDRVCQAIKLRFEDVEVAHTICAATVKRQNEVRDLAQRNDCVLVIGGANSSNTRRLHEIAGEITRAHLISGVEDLRNLDFRGVSRLGITAGASTPDWLIEDVVEEVQRLNLPPFTRFIQTVAGFLNNANVLFAFSPFLLALTVADITGLPVSFGIAALISCFYVSMSLLNALTNRAAMQIDNRKRYEFLNRTRHVHGLLIGASLVSMLTIAWHLSLASLILALVALCLGIAYSLCHLPSQKSRRRIFFFRRRDLQAIKSLVISLAVSLLLIGLPLLEAHPDLLLEVFRQGWSHPALSSLGLWFSFYYMFLLMFTRQALIEIKTAQSDRIAGVSSLMSLVSRRHIVVVLITLPTLLLCIMTMGALFGHFPVHQLKYFIAVGFNYAMVFLALHPIIQRRRFLFGFCVEANPLVAGLTALL